MRGLAAPDTFPYRPAMPDSSSVSQTIGILPSARMIARRRVARWKWSASIPSRGSARCAAPAANDYTAGVICAKVARYAERQHHPAPFVGSRCAALAPRGCGRGRLRARFRGTKRSTKPPTEAEGSGGREIRAPKRCGPISMPGRWVLVQRDGIDRLRNVDGLFAPISRRSASRWPMRAGTGGGRRQARHRRARRSPKSDFDRRVGRQSRLHPSQRHDPYFARTEEVARREAGRRRSLSHAARPQQADHAFDGEAPVRTPRLAVWASCMCCSPKASPTAITSPSYTTRRRGELETHVAEQARPNGRKAICGVKAGHDPRIRADLYGSTKRSLLAPGLRFRAPSQRFASSMHAAASLCPRSRALGGTKGGGALYGAIGDLRARQDADPRDSTDSIRSVRRARPKPYRPGVDRR